MIRFKTNGVRENLNFAKILPSFTDKGKGKLTLAVFIASGIVALLSIQAASSEPNSTTSNPATSSTEITAATDTDKAIPFEKQSTGNNFDDSSRIKISDSNASVSVDSDSQAQVKQSGSSVSIRIESNSSSSNSESPGTESEKPLLTINGQEVAIPKNGRVNETIKDENTKTRLRADIDGDGSSSINISTKTTN